MPFTPALVTMNLQVPAGKCGANAMVISRTMVSVCNTSKGSSSMPFLSTTEEEEEEEETEEEGVTPGSVRMEVVVCARFAGGVSAELSAAGLFGTHTVCLCCTSYIMGVRRKIMRALIIFAHASPIAGTLVCTEKGAAFAIGALSSAIRSVI